MLQVFGVCRDRAAIEVLLSGKGMTVRLSKNAEMSADFFWELQGYPDTFVRSAEASLDGREHKEFFYHRPVVSGGFRPASDGSQMIVLALHWVEDDKNPKKTTYYEVRLRPEEVKKLVIVLQGYWCAEFCFLR